MDDISRNIDQQLIQAYKATTYEVANLNIFIKIGEANPQLDEFLMDNNVFTWAFIAAWNPQSQQLSDAENEARHFEFLKMLNDRKFRFVEGQGTPAQENWKPEKSILILDISKKEAIEIGHFFNQNAIVFGRLGGLPELLWMK